MSLIPPEPEPPPKPDSSLESDLPPEPAFAAVERKLEPEDFYMDGPYLVFTEAYHLKRGYCCHSGCRHCPYQE